MKYISYIPVYTENMLTNDMITNDDAFCFFLFLFFLLLVVVVMVVVTFQPCVTQMYLCAAQICDHNCVCGCVRMRTGEEEEKLSQLAKMLEGYLWLIALSS